jgi:D-amino-acid dehydrogenase
MTDVAVVGGGVVGLATAWFLQELGASVTVFDRSTPGSGASSGNAGWITPSMAAPLPEPAIMRAAPRLLLARNSPVTVTARPEASLIRFLASFARNTTTGRWQRGMRAFAELNRGALDAYDALAEGGVGIETTVAEPLVAGWVSAAEREAFAAELRHSADFGLPVDFDLVSGDEARRLQPLLSDRISAGMLLRGQRYVDPLHLCASVATEIIRRGGVIDQDTMVERIIPSPGAIQLSCRGAQGHDAGVRVFDNVVIATGADLGRLAATFGVRAVVQAGRGYSFFVTPRIEPRVPFYLPGARLACTPFGSRLRIAGLMEFTRADAPLSARRIQAMVASARGLVRDIDLEVREQEWVGSRPCTTDGLPLIGRTRHPRVHVIGGHGMWGVTLGPESGRLLAASILSGKPQPSLAACDPLR